MQRKYEIMIKHLQDVLSYTHTHTHTVLFDPHANPVMYKWNSYPRLIKCEVA